MFTARERAQNQEIEAGRYLDRVEWLNRHDVGVRVEKFLYCREELKFEPKQTIKEEHEN